MFGNSACLTILLFSPLLLIADLQLIVETEQYIHLYNNKNFVRLKKYFCFFSSRNAGDGLLAVGRVERGPHRLPGGHGHVHQDSEEEGTQPEHVHHDQPQ
jgi:hypothetical protein